MALVKYEPTTHINITFNKSIGTLVTFIQRCVAYRVMIRGLLPTYSEWEAWAIRIFAEAYFTYHDPKKIAERKRKNKTISKFNTYLTSALNNFISKKNSEIAMCNILLKDDIDYDTGIFRDTDSIEFNFDDFDESFKLYLIEIGDKEVLDLYIHIVSKKNRLRQITGKKRMPVLARLYKYYMQFNSI